MCDEQIGLNYQATLENQNKIIDIEKQLHDKEMYLDEANTSLRNEIETLRETIRRLEQEIDMIKFRERQSK